MPTPGSQQVKKRVLERANLLSIFLVITGLRRHCRVVGDSMMPTISHGDLVIYRPIKNKQFIVKEGCIVVISHPLDPKNLMVKRVHQCNKWAIDLRGDNETSSIDSRQFGVVNHQHLRGIVEQIIPKK